MAGGKLNGFIPFEMALTLNNVDTLSALDNAEKLLAVNNADKLSALVNTEKLSALDNADKLWALDNADKPSQNLNSAFAVSISDDSNHFTTCTSINKLLRCNHRN